MLAWGYEFVRRVLVAGYGACLVRCTMNHSTQFLFILILPFAFGACSSSTSSTPQNDAGACGAMLAGTTCKRTDGACEGLVCIGSTWQCPSGDTQVALTASSCVAGDAAAGDGAADDGGTCGKLLCGGRRRWRLNRGSLVNVARGRKEPRASSASRALEAAVTIAPPSSSTSRQIADCLGDRCSFPPNRDGSSAVRLPRLTSS
jgi:hypothetical protein